MLARIVVFALLSLAPSLAAQTGPLRLDLNIPANRLVVYEGDTPIRTYPVSVGLPGHDTPTGKFAIATAEWNPWWRPPAREWARNDKVTPPGPNNPMGRVKLFFMPLYFIHGTPDAENIGQAASHGCVRMLNKDVIALSRLLHQRSAPHVSPAEIDRILSRSSATRRVAFRDSIPLEIRYDPVEVVDGRLHVYPDIYKYRAFHSERVYQALLRAGYDVAGLKPADVRRVVERGRAAKAPFSLSVEEAFGTEVASTARPAADRSR